MFGIDVVSFVGRNCGLHHRDSGFALVVDHPHAKFAQALDLGMVLGAAKDQHIGIALAHQRHGSAGGIDRRKGESHKTRPADSREVERLDMGRIRKQHRLAPRLEVPHGIGIHLQHQRIDTATRERLIKSATNRAPRNKTPGWPGEHKSLKLELKVLADVGLLGMPNAGKSTLIAAISNARPKIADYPFTTLHPNLGVVRVGPERSFVIADLPGLIEGASEGRGLGMQFLAHVERCKVLLHLVDGTSSTVTKDYRTIVHELEAYSEVLGDKPRILALNKVDAMDPKQISDRRRALEKASGGEVFVISGVAGRGLQDVLREIYARIKAGNAKPEEVTPWRP